MKYIRKIGRKIDVEKDEFKTSNFMITINTNEQKKMMTETKIKNFDNAINYIFSEQHILSFLMDRNNEIITKDRINEIIFSDLKPELSNIKGALHWHVVLQIKHTYKLAIDRIKISAFFRKAFGKNVYINIRSSGDSFEKFISYSLK